MKNIKNAYVTLIFKQDDNMNKVKYRRISLVLKITKIFDRLTHRQLSQAFHTFFPTIRGT